MFQQAKKAEAIAFAVHEGQTRRDGTKYISHPQWIAEQFRDQYALQAVAWLHDTVEDGGLFAIQEMKKGGILPDIQHAVILLTRINNEDWMTYIKRLAKNQLARKVKIVDLVHNVTDAPTEAARKRYRDALAYLITVGN